MANAGGDAFDGSVPPVVRKGVVVRGPARAVTRGELASRNVIIGLNRARRALFASTVKHAVTRGIAFDDEAKDRKKPSPTKAGPTTVCSRHSLPSPP